MADHLPVSKVAALSLSALVATLVIASNCKGSKQPSTVAPPTVVTAAEGTGSGSGAEPSAQAPERYLPATKAGVLGGLTGSGPGASGTEQTNPDEDADR